LRQQLVQCLKKHRLPLWSCLTN